MQTIELKATQSTPYVLLNNDGRLYLRGRSYMEDAEQFYHPILDWVSTFLQSVPAKASLTLEVEHFNSRSVRQLLRLLSELDDYAHQHPGACTVVWEWVKGNEDQLTDGQMFLEMLPELKIQMRERENPSEEGQSMNSINGSAGRPEEEG